MYKDIIIEGIPKNDDFHSLPVLPSEYDDKNLGCIPKIDLPNGKYLFYMRGGEETINQLKLDSRVKSNIIADSWTELFYSNYNYWNWVFDFEVMGYSELYETNKKIVLRKKLKDIQNEDIIGVYVPGIIAGDSVPELEVPQFIIEGSWKLKADLVQFQPSINKISNEFRKYLTQNPNFIYSLTPRKFEEFICNVLKDLGWNVDLTAATKDGGYDIFGSYNQAGGISSHWIIECKRYASTNKIGVDIVRSIIGVKDQLKVGNAMIVTSSSFTKGAYEFKQKRQDLELKDYKNIMDWLKPH